MTEHDATIVATPISQDLRVPVRAIACLEVIDGPDAGRRHALPEGRTVIGRSPGCGIILTEGQVSREHAEVVHDNGVCILRDLGSTNGTFVDGTDVFECVLHEGDVIAVGDNLLVFAHDRVRMG